MRVRQPEPIQRPVNGDPPFSREVPHEIAGRLDASWCHADISSRSRVGWPDNWVASRGGPVCTPWERNPQR